MKISEEDIRRDENAKDYIDLTHIEMPLPDINDMSEYESIGKEAFKNVPYEKVQEVFDFLEKLGTQKNDSQS